MQQNPVARGQRGSGVCNGSVGCPLPSFFRSRSASQMFGHPGHREETIVTKACDSILRARPRFWPSALWQFRGGKTDFQVPSAAFMCELSPFGLETTAILSSHGEEKFAAVIFRRQDMF